MVVLLPLAAANPATGHAPGAAQDEGPPAPEDPAPEESDVSDQSDQPEQSEQSDDDAEEEVEGPVEQEAITEQDMIIGLEPGLPQVPEQQETRYGTDDVRRGLFLIGGGVGIGFFLPGDVNDYLEGWPQREGGLAVQEVGFTEMVVNYVPRVTFTYIPIEYVQLQALGEIGWSPKVMTLQGEGVETKTEWFHYVRYSPGALANFHLPVNANRQSLFVGGGVLYHWLRFTAGSDEYKAEALGYRAQIGYRFYIRKFAPEVFVAFDYVKADSGKALPDSNRDMVLDYTGGMVGGNFFFDLTAAVGAT
jgi:hypothetical protein